MNSDIFRKEALEAKRSHLMGAIVIKPKPQTKYVAAIAIGFLLLVACFLLIASYTKKATLHGMVTPENGIFRLTASIGGHITAVNIKENSKVKKGEILFRISSSKIVDGIYSEKRSLDEIEIKKKLLNDARENSHQKLKIATEHARSKILIAVEEEKNWLQELELLQARLDLAQVNLQRQEQLKELGYITDLPRNQAKNEFLAIKIQQIAGQRSLANAKKEKRQVQTVLFEAEIAHRHEINQINQATSNLEGERFGIIAGSGTEIVAPFDGYERNINSRRSASGTKFSTCHLDTRRNSIGCPSLRARVRDGKK